MLQIIKVGNYMKSNHDASRVVSGEGVAPCVKGNHMTVTAVLVVEDDEEEKNNNFLCNERS